MRNNYKQNILRSAKGLLVMLISFFAFSVSGQTLTVEAPANVNNFVGEDTTYTFQAAGYPDGTSFILFYGNSAIDFDAEDNSDLILGQSSVQDSDVEFDFTWPESGSYQLRLHAVSGDDFKADIDSVTVDLDDTDQSGSNDDGIFSRAGTRSLITDAVDLSSADTVTIFFDFEELSDDIYTTDTLNYVKFYYSTNGGTTYTSLEEVGAASDTLAGDGSKVFQLPESAYTSSVMFKVEQFNSASLAAGVRGWSITSDIILTLEEAYASIDDSISAITYNVINPSITIDSVYVTGDDTDVSSAYTGDEVVITAAISDGADIDLYNYGAIFVSGSNERFYLEGETFDNVNDTVFTITGSIPVGVNYDNYDLYVAAYSTDDSQLLWSDSYNPDFTDSDDFDELTVENGVVNGSNIEFSGIGERSITFPAFDFASIENDSIKIWLGRSSSLLSPSGTNLILEYTDEEGGAFTEIASIALNSLSSTGTTVYSLDAAEYPTGMITASTILRIRQEGQNGTNLDTWFIGGVSFEGFDNLSDIVNDDDISFDVLRPAITLNALNIESDNLSYPMTDQTFTFSIDEGQFPTGTSAKLLLDAYSDEEFDIVIGELASVANVTTNQSIDFKVPALDGGDYTLYLYVDGEKYYSVTLPIYEVTISITDVSFSMPVEVAGEQYAVPGSTATVTYEYDGEPGSGAQLVLSVLNSDGDWIQLNATETLDGTITGVLPQDMDYPDSPDVPTLKLSLATGLFNTSSFSSVVNENLYSEELEEYFGTLVGTQDDGGTPDVFYGPSERSATTMSFDFSYGGEVEIELDNVNYSSEYDVTISISTDGETWEEFETNTNTGSGVSFSFDVPNEYYSDSVYLKIAYDESFSAGVNTSKVSTYYIATPTFQETADVEFEFGLVEPYINLAEVSTAYTIGQDIEVSYNAEYFPEDVEFAAVIDQDGEIYVIGTSSEQGAQTISGTVPLIIPLNEDSPTDPYEVSVIPFIPGADGDYYPADGTIDLDTEEDFPSLVGVSSMSEDYLYDSLVFDSKGERTVTTAAYDLSGADSVTLQFKYYSTVTLSSNTNTIPRLEASTDGTTFTALEVFEDEDDMYQTGLLYNSNSTVSVGIPEEFLVDGVMFRWSQPLNLGENKSVWTISWIDLIFDLGNELPAYLFTQSGQEQAITIENPSASDYVWMQSDLEDAVFNGESFSYSWNYNEDFIAPDTFPAGTEFTFILHDGSGYVIDPDTDLPYVVGSTTSLGDSFEGSIPFYAGAGTYSIRLIATLEVDEEVYYLYGDEDGTSITEVGTLDVFLKVIRTSIELDENDVLYAGNTATFSIDVENDETNTIAIDDLFANLLLVDYDGNKDLILATQEGTGDITVDLPPYVKGNYSFVIEFTEGAPLGDVGALDAFEFDELSSDDDNLIAKSNFLSGELQVVTSRVFDQSDVDDSDAQLYYQVNFDASSTVIFEYSLNGGDWVVDETESNGYGSGYSPVFDLTGSNTVQFRWSYDVNPEFEVLDVSYARWYDGDSYVYNIQSDSYYFPDGNTADEIYFENDFGRGLITTRDITSEELENKKLLSFDISFDELAEDILESQFLIFEYSVDMGATYSQIDTFPYTDMEEVLDGDTYLQELTEDMASGVRFRFRQEERNEIGVAISNFMLKSGETLPFDYIATDERTIAPQQLIITALDTDELCQGDAVTIDYEILGRFGEENVITVNYMNVAGGSGTIDGLEVMAFEGTGSVEVSLPNDILSAGSNNAWYRFSLDADDDTYNEEYGDTYSIEGVYSETNVELVAPIDQGTTFSVAIGSGTDILDCAPEEVIVTINSPRDYFQYDVIDLATDAVLGTLVYDPEDPETTVTLAALTEATDLGLQITSMSSSGTTCNTLMSTDEEEIEVLENYELYVNITGTSTYEMVADGLALSVCESSSYYSFRAVRLRESGNQDLAPATIVEWFRDDLSTPVYAGQTLEISEMTESGSYFARISEGSCSYTTMPVAITLEDAPEKPEITVVSGNVKDCESSDDVVLSGPDGFEYYQWTSGETTQVITADNTGTYSVQVSNVPFGTSGSCASPYSNPVVVSRYALPEFDLTLNNYLPTGKLVDGEEITACDNEVIYFHANEAASAGYSGYLTVRILKDGELYAYTESSSYTLTESGEYSFEIVHEDNNTGCTTSAPSISLTIVEQPTETPLLTADGPLEFCAEKGSFVTLTAPEGFDYYQWRRGTSTIFTTSDGFAATDNTLEVSTAGDYTVYVGNASGCWSPVSNKITLKTKSLPILPSFSQTDATCGEGSVEFSFYSYQGFTYQLINSITGLASGDPVDGVNGTVYIYSDPITEGTPFYLEASYADGSGCVNFDEFNTRWGYVNNVTLDLTGATLSAEISNYSGYSEIRWYRNDVLMVNPTNNFDTEITVLDNATYMVEVDFEGVGGVCTVSSNAIDLSGRAGQPTLPGTSAIVASTYPNPTSDLLNLEIPGEELGAVRVQIMTLSGQIVMDQTFDKDVEEFTKQINIATFEAGIYNMTVRQGSKVENIRIVKQ